MTIQRIKLPNGCYVERDPDGSIYYSLPNVICNRIDPDNLDNFKEPQRTWIADAVRQLNETKGTLVDLYEKEI